MTDTTFDEPNAIIEHPRFGLGRIKGEALDTFRNQGSTLLAWWPIREEPPRNLSFKGIMEAYKEWKELKDPHLTWSSVVSAIRKSEKDREPMSQSLRQLVKKMEQIVRNRVEFELNETDPEMFSYLSYREDHARNDLIAALRAYKTDMMAYNTDRIVDAYWEGKRME